MVGDVLSRMADDATVLLGILERLSRARDPMVALEVEGRCESLRRAARWVQLALLAEGSK